MRRLISKGFTVIELIVVIVIIGILAAMVIQKMIPTTSITAEQSASMVAADIRTTQDLAMADIASHTITFTSGSNTYTIDQGRATAQIISLPSGVTTNTSATITFNTRGEPNAGATINVGGATTVTVVQNTGRVTIP